MKEFVMEDVDSESGSPSKSERKRQMTTLQKWGEVLVGLPKERLKKLSLPDKLYSAVEEAQRMTAHGGLRRQMQYIGRLMREIDAEPIVAQLENWQTHERQDNARFHRLEIWRDRLIAEDDALPAVLAIYPGIDVQPLRTLIRNARKEKNAGSAPKSSRALFKLLRAADERTDDGADEWTDDVYQGAEPVTGTVTENDTPDD